MTKSLKEILICLFLAGLVSFVSFLIVGYFSGLLIGGIIIRFRFAINIAVCIIVNAVNVYVYIRMRFISDGSGKRKVLSDYPDEYPGIFKDMLKTVKDEKLTFIAALGVSVLIWMLVKTDFFIFKRQLLSVPVALIFVSFVFFSTLHIFPETSIVGYLIGTVIFCVMYIVGLTIARKIWHSRRLHREKADIK